MKPHINNWFHFSTEVHSNCYSGCKKKGLKLFKVFATSHIIVIDLEIERRIIGIEINVESRHIYRERGTNEQN